MPVLDHQVNGVTLPCVITQGPRFLPYFDSSYPWMILFYSDRPQSIYISGGSKEKGVIEEGANGPRHRSCMSCLQSIGEKSIPLPHCVAQVTRKWYRWGIGFK